MTQIPSCFVVTSTNVQDLYIKTGKKLVLMSDSILGTVLMTFVYLPQSPMCEGTQSELWVHACKPGYDFFFATHSSTFCVTKLFLNRCVPMAASRCLLASGVIFISVSLKIFYPDFKCHSCTITHVLLSFTDYPIDGP